MGYLNKIVYLETREQFNTLVATGTVTLSSGTVVVYNVNDDYRIPRTKIVDIGNQYVLKEDSYVYPVLPLHSAISAVNTYTAGETAIMKWSPLSMPMTITVLNGSAVPDSQSVTNYNLVAIIHGKVVKYEWTSSSTESVQPQIVSGGGGAEYTAGNGISITDNEISIDEDVVATKSELSSKADDDSVVHLTDDETIGGVKTFTGTIKLSGSNDSGIFGDQYGNLKFKRNGSIILSVANYVGPGTNNSTDLGSASVKWRDLYLGRDLYLTGALKDDTNSVALADIMKKGSAVPVIDTPSSTNLTTEQANIFKTSGCIVKGTFPTTSYVDSLFLAARDMGQDRFQGVVISGSSQFARVSLYRITGDNNTLAIVTNLYYLDINNLNNINGKKFPLYPTNPTSAKVLTYGTDNNLSWGDLPDVSDLVTESEFSTALATKQDTLTQGTGIVIDDDIISADTDVLALKSELTDKVDYTDIVDNLTSSDALKVLSAKMGKELSDRISNLETLGRYLSEWDCSTGLALTNPPASPYAYKTGDTFWVQKVASAGGTNYKPSGTSYVTGSASTVVETEEVVPGDIYIYDGTVWSLRKIALRTVLFSNVAGDPMNNTSLASLFNAKANASDIPDVSGFMSKADPTGTGSFSLNRKADTVVGDYSFAEGYHTTARGRSSHAEGDQTNSWGSATHAEGRYCVAGTMNWSTDTVASHAEGYSTRAYGNYSHAEGCNTEADGASQHVFGEYNVVDDSNNGNIENRGTYVEIVGNGSFNSSAGQMERSNARTLDWSGNERLKGTLYVGCNDDSTGGSEVATKASLATVATSGSYNDLSDQPTIPDVSALITRIAALEAKTANMSVSGTTTTFSGQVNASSFNA